MLLLAIGLVFFAAVYEEHSCFDILLYMYLVGLGGDGSGMAERLERIQGYDMI